MIKSLSNIHSYNNENSYQTWIKVVDTGEYLLEEQPSPTVYAFQVVTLYDDGFKEPVKDFKYQSIACF